LPPATPPTCQETVVSLEFWTVAEKATLPVPVSTLAEVGAIVTVTAGGALLALLPPSLVLLPPQAASNPDSSTVQEINRKTILPNGLSQWPQPIASANCLRTIHVEELI
jgi:hypothetical protein